MRFTDGFWQPRAGVTPLFARQVHDIWVDGETLRVFAPTGQVSHRSDTLNRPLLTVTVSSPLENIIRMRVDHFQCGSEKVAFGMPGATQGSAEVTVDDVRGVLRSGELSATVIKGNAWALSFDAGERHLTSSGEKCFEGLPDAGVFKRWTAFGLLSSHSRFHGSTSYRVPWMFDDEAVEVTRRFTKLKLRLMPYLYAAGIEASQSGTPVMRPMQLEFRTTRPSAISTGSICSVATCWSLRSSRRTAPSTSTCPQGPGRTISPARQRTGRYGGRRSTGTSPSTSATALCCRSAARRSGPTTATSTGLCWRRIRRLFLRPGNAP